MKSTTGARGSWPQCDRSGGNGSKRHLLVDGRGVPLSLIVTGTNRHDVSQLETILVAIMVKRLQQPPMRRSKHLYADAGYTEAPALLVIEQYGYIPRTGARARSRRTET